MISSWLYYPLRPCFNHVPFTQAQVSIVSCEGEVLEDGQAVVNVTFKPNSGVSEMDHWSVTSSWNGIQQVVIHSWVARAFSCREGDSVGYNANFPNSISKCAAGVTR